MLANSMAEPLPKGLSDMMARMEAVMNERRKEGPITPFVVPRSLVETNPDGSVILNADGTVKWKKVKPVAVIDEGYIGIPWHMVDGDSVSFASPSPASPAPLPPPPKPKLEPIPLVKNKSIFVTIGDNVSTAVLLEIDTFGTWTFTRNTEIDLPIGWKEEHTKCMLKICDNARNYELMVRDFYNMLKDLPTDPNPSGTFPDGWTDEMTNTINRVILMPGQLAIDYDGLIDLLVKRPSSDAGDIPLSTTTPTAAPPPPSMKEKKKFDPNANINFPNGWTPAMTDTMQMFIDDAARPDDMRAEFTSMINGLSKPVEHIDGFPPGWTVEMEQYMHYSIQNAIRPCNMLVRIGLMLQCMTCNMS